MRGLVNAPLCALPSTTASRPQQQQCTCSASAGARGPGAFQRAHWSRSRSTQPTRLPTTAAAQTASTSTLPPLYPIDDRYDDLHSFSNFAHWIIPNRLMVGRYPFCEPSRCKSRDLGEAQLEQILKAGITAFVCLQSELPPQNQLRIGGKDGFLPYRPTAQLIAAALSGPPPTSSLHDLRTPDLDRFLPPRRKSVANLTGGAPRREVDFLHFGIPDLRVPDEQSALEAVDAIEGLLKAGGVPYVHCWGGRGRSGLIAACLLGKAYGLSADQALERVSRSYQTREREYSSPETAEQVQFVRDFIAKHAG